MSGEFKVSDIAVSQALQEASEQPSMSEDTMLAALLNSLVTHLVVTKNKADILNLVEFLIDSQSQDEVVVTRGC